MASAAVAQHRVVLGVEHWAGTNSSGWGTARPNLIYNGGDADGSVSHIRWSSWGGRTARGIGEHPTYKPSGGYYLPGLKAQLRATDRGRCYRGGPLAYKKLYVRLATRPGGPLSKWFSWSGRKSLCHPLSVDARSSSAASRRQLPRMLYPVINYGSPRGGLIWHVWLRPRHWTDGDDVMVTRARWLSWTATSAVARVHVDIAGHRGVGTVRLSSPGYCPAARAYGFLTETDSGRPWGGNNLPPTSYAASCREHAN